MDYPSMTEEDKKWQAENDAHTLAEAEVIKGDSKRLKAAQETAKKISEEAEERAKGMKAISNMGYKSMKEKQD